MKGTVLLVPMNFRKGVFSMTSVDNIDVHTKATLLTTSPQMTASSLNQQPTTLNQKRVKIKKFLDSKK